MREAFARLAGRVLRTALLAETRCPGCGRITADGLGQCPDCRAAIAPLGGGPCPGCGEYPGSAQDVPVLCGRCREKPRPWNRTLVYGPYAGPLKDLILGYKFEDRLDFGQRLQEFALETFERGLAASPELAACDMIVPVPLHPRRLLARGFNQSLEVARLLSARRALPIRQEGLCRVRRTTPQMELAREARAENIKGAFAASGPLLAGRNVLLVDDIMTTGATLEECARAMLNAGALRVDVLVLARA
ncbi:MAG: ComF family protein [Humidesulfovibrio sp.]|uniref:ComF family protein n=1 Tax=Humidesulfovibrio sp. TaxID=2910988 RepID=UPI00273707F7|nr:ComF family protein [Humidesulfovibrio sp.]MDP2846669.1 ComF family protein [Humidesulfovibrio sp.]